MSLSPGRRVRIASREASSDLDFESWADCLDEVGSAADFEEALDKGQLGLATSNVRMIFSW